MANHKDNARILSNDVCDYIATHSSLSRQQVKECFKTYRQLLEDVTTSDFFKEDITIVFPHLGYFYFKKKGGRKKGCTYRIPNVGGIPNKVRFVTLEEDEPDTYKIAFRVSTVLNNKFRQRYLKK